MYVCMYYVVDTLCIPESIPIKSMFNTVALTCGKHRSANKYCRHGLTPNTADLSSFSNFEECLNRADLPITGTSISLSVRL